MSKSPTNGPQTDTAKDIFLRVISKDSAERYIRLADIKRIDEVEGRMRLAFRYNSNATHFYFIPGLSYEDAKNKLKKIPQLTLADLSQDIDAEAAKHIFIRATRPKDDKERHIRTDDIKRLDNENGRLRIAFEYSTDGTILYPVPDISYEEAIEKIERLQGRQYINLEQL